MIAVETAKPHATLCHITEKTQPANVFSAKHLPVRMASRTRLGQPLVVPCCLLVCSHHGSFESGRPPVPDQHTGAGPTRRACAAPAFRLYPSFDYRISVRKNISLAIAGIIDSLGYCPDCATQRLTRLAWHRRPNRLCLQPVMVITASLCSGQALEQSDAGPTTGITGHSGGGQQLADCPTQRLVLATTSGQPDALAAGTSDDVHGWPQPRASNYNRPPEARNRDTGPTSAGAGRMADSNHWLCGFARPLATGASRITACCCRLSMPDSTLALASARTTRPCIHFRDADRLSMARSGADCLRSCADIPVGVANQRTHDQYRSTGHPVMLHHVAQPGPTTEAQY